MKLASLIVLAAFSAASINPALAQTTAPTTKSPAATSAKAQPRAQRTAKSLDCSKQADAKKIHGKERRKFLNSCKKG